MRGGIREGLLRTDTEAAACRVPLLTLARPVASALRRLARRSYPREACGVLLGHRDPYEQRVEALVPGKNVHDEPRSAFELHPATVVVAERIARARGLALIGFYHTHPDGALWPSAADRDAAWDNTLGLIVAVDARARTGIRGHLWRGGRAVPLLRSVPESRRGSGRAESTDDSAPSAPSQVSER